MNFGLITEGASEHRIIRHLLEKYFKDDAPVINQVQPKIINEKQVATGGWNEVLKYCERDEIRAALVENDYLVIQIDTDQSATRPFSITHTSEHGKPKTTEQLHDEVVQKLTSLIRKDILEQYNGRIFFAVCIHTIECWLLPVFCDDRHKADTTNCIATLNASLKRKDIHIVSASNKNRPNGIRSYDEILKGLRKKTDIENSSKHNYGFSSFIKSLKSVRPDAGK